MAKWFVLGEEHRFLGVWFPYGIAYGEREEQRAKSQVWLGEDVANPKIGMHF